jgi:glucose/arabinose dehydrogenase
MRALFCLLVAIPAAHAADLKPTVVAGGLAKPNSVTVTPDKRIFVSTDAGIVEIKDGTSSPFAVEAKAVSSHSRMRRPD